MCLWRYLWRVVSGPHFDDEEWWTDIQEDDRAPSGDVESGPDPDQASSAGETPPPPFDEETAPFLTADMREHGE